MGKMRLVTRSDFDGLVCAMILKELDIIDDIKFARLTLLKMISLLTSLMIRE